MLEAPEGWDELYGSGEYVVEPRIRFFPNGKKDGSYEGADCYEVYSDNISSSGVTLESSCFSDLSLGNVCSSCLRATLKDMPAAFGKLCPKWTPLDFHVRLASPDGSTVTDWVQQGFFRVDELVDASGTGDFSLTAYDDITYLGSVYYLGKSTGQFNEFAMLASEHTDIFENNRIEGFAASPFLPPSGKLATGKTLREILDVYVAEDACNVFVSKGNVAKASRPRSNLVAADGGDPVSATAVSIDTDMPPVCGIAIATGSERMFYSQGGCLVKLNGVSAELIEEYEGNGLNKFDLQLERLDNFAFFGTDYFGSVSASEKYREPISFADVSVEGAVVSPLFELGDYVTLEVGDGLARFYPSGYRLTYAGDCIGTLTARRSSEATVLRRYEDDPDSWTYTTSYYGSSSGSSYTYTGEIERLGTSGWAVVTFPEIYLDTAADMDQEKYNVAYYAGSERTDGRLEIFFRYRETRTSSMTYTSNGYAYLPEGNNSYFKVRPAHDGEPGMVVEGLQLLVKNSLFKREPLVVEDASFVARNNSGRLARFYITGRE